MSDIIPTLTPRIFLYVLNASISFNRPWIHSVRSINIKDDNRLTELINRYSIYLLELPPGLATGFSDYIVEGIEKQLEYQIAFVEKLNKQIMRDYLETLQHRDIFNFSVTEDDNPRVVYRDLFSVNNEQSLFYELFAEKDKLKIVISSLLSGKIAAILLTDNNTNSPHIQFYFSEEISLNRLFMQAIMVQMVVALNATLRHLLQVKWEEMTLTNEHMRLVAQAQVVAPSDLVASKLDL